MSRSVCVNYWITTGFVARNKAVTTPHPSLPALGPTQPPVLWVSGISRGYSTRGVALSNITHLAPRLSEGRAYVGMFCRDIYLDTEYVPIAHK